jgi:hypothetical protein
MISYHHNVQYRKKIVAARCIAAMTQISIASVYNNLFRGDITPFYQKIRVRGFFDGYSDVP